ncbi:MAG: chemotaxis protein CheW [Abyssibacter sp.]|uniref:chemotaxis protein CheW n=1 Tax=Abyssibacter sp. TaxID=2320200 RepID=UPI002EB2F720|nr:chemotaxis protein CheW [Pseudomonadota bacterium]
MDDALPDQVYGALVALNGETWLLPNAAIADVLAFDNVELNTGSPDWLFGFVDWRDRRLPLIAAEGLLGLPIPERMPRARLLVMNTVTDQVQAGQYVLVAQGYPQLVTVNERAVQQDWSDGLPERANTACRVRIGSNSALIPDLDRIEAKIASALVRVEATSLEPIELPTLLS